MLIPTVFTPNESFKQICKSMLLFMFDCTIYKTTKIRHSTEKQQMHLHYVDIPNFFTSFDMKCIIGNVLFFVKHIFMLSTSLFGIRDISIAVEEQ